MENIKNEEATVIIGLPVYNGERTIEKTLNSIVKQTFTDFKVIISDNHSTDTTSEICKEFSKKYPKITYFQQNENKGPLFNFTFVLNSANSEYFVWIAADDWWEPTFLEKNIKVLNVDKKFVGSISKIDFYDTKVINYKEKDNILKSKIKKFYSYDEFSNCKNYEDRVSFILRIRNAGNIYGVFRTPILKKCVEKLWKKNSIAMDSKIILFIQRFGEINVLNEFLLHRSGKGMSAKPQYAEMNEFGIVGKIFPFLSFSIWILKNLGIRIFIKNLDYILLLNASGSKFQLKQFFKKC